MGLIYITTNLINNRKYIGKQWDESKKNYYGSGKALKLALKKYGVENFKKEILEESIQDTKLLSEREKYFIRINKANTSIDYYNIAEGGNGGRTRINQVWTLESREKARLSAIERNKNPEYLKKLSLIHKGKTVSLKIRKKLSIAHQNQDNLNLAKSVIQYDLEGTLIKEYISISQACRDLGHNPNKGGQITRCCRNFNYTGLGFKWKYKNNEE